MRRLAIILTLCAGCVIAADAQSTFTQQLQKSRAGDGKVTVTEDKAIDDLVNGPKTDTAQPAKPKTTPATTPQPKAEEKTPAQPKTTEPKPTQADTRTTPEGTPDTTYIEDTRKKVMKGGYKINGYRVQVYAGGNSRDARIKAEKTGKEINSLFPGEPVYVHFYSPRWICRMGNYRTYEEAHQVLNQVKKLGYNSAIIVKGKITVPYLTPPTNP